MRRSIVRTVNCDSNHEKVANMDPMKLQLRSSRPGYKNPYKQNAKSRLVFYISIAFAAVFLCCILFSPNRTAVGSYVQKKYGIVIDGGSTGTRIHVFNYKDQDGILKYDFGKDGLASMKVNPGLSAYAEEPEKAGAAVEELLEFGRKRVPREYWRETEIRLMATAGMRLLENDVQEKVVEACRKVLRGSGFRFYDDWAAVISGMINIACFCWMLVDFGFLNSIPSYALVANDECFIWECLIKLV